MAAPRPYTLVAELTYKCPLKCLYCSNPVNFHEMRNELSTEQWVRTFSEAADLGVVQLHLSGGEPVVRKDLPELIRHARSRDLYTNLIT
ncbi:MAG: radical SAM protein, partial [candidate division NC10 bacterium]|nr:radical SAM protein [candidate division NC10 bacterium]